MKKNIATLAHILNFSLIRKFKITLYCSVGNLLELYDYILFAVMIKTISQQFFPTDDLNTALILGYLTFSISFIFSSLGSIFWGWYVDRFGQRSMINLSMILMCIPSITISILPSYKTIGIMAPIILVISRIIQGISASGEIQGIKIFAMENSDQKSIGITSGILHAAGALGIIIAMLMGYMVSVSDSDYIWRVPFLLGGIIGYVGLIIRRQKLPIKSITKKDAKINDLWRIIKSYKYESISVFCIGSILGSFSYMLYAFLNPFVVKYGLSEDKAYILSIIALISAMTSSVIAGVCSDKTKNPEKMITNNMMILIVLLTPIFLIMKGKIYALNIIAFIILGLLLGANSALGSLLMYKAFPKEVRYRGILFLYSVSIAIFGGCAPIILNFAGQFDFIFPAIIMTLFHTFMFSLYQKASRKIKWNN